MALLSNGTSIPITSANTSPPKSSANNQNERHHDIFLTNLLNTLPQWDTIKTSGPLAVPQEPQNFFAHGLGAIGQHTTASIHSDVMVNPLNGNTPGSSPQTIDSSNSSANNCNLPSYDVHCGRCDLNAGSRCLDCNDALCEECTLTHQRHTLSREHCVVPLNNLSPIGSSMFTGNGAQNQMDPQCEIHCEVLRYVCETCKMIVCQECTLRDHKDHECVLISSFSENAPKKIMQILESGTLGKTYIKASIDRAVLLSQTVEKESMEMNQKIRKAMRHFIIAAEDREKTLLEQVDKVRQQKLTTLSDQMDGLRAALAGLAQTSELLSKTLKQVHVTSSIDLAKTLTKGESKMEQFATMYKNLQPKEEFISFVQPNFELLEDIRKQGDIIIMGHRSNGTVQSIQQSPPFIGSSANGNNMPVRRPIVRSSGQSLQSNSISAWDQLLMPKNLTSISPPLKFVGQCIPGSMLHISAQPTVGPSFSFAFDGHQDGQVSRPWGLCIDKDGHIIVADRRNNRIQVYYSDGMFKLKFGCKGSGNGQFDLPAGISTDPQNRIVVVDKDNHRVQLFTCDGIFLFKFGSYGKDCGQFQYPWDVAVNSKGEMLVTDSRNHRIQLFNSDGHFISRFSFDGINHSRSLKGLTTPRGACFTPQGDIIVSDFENHRLLLIDSRLTKVIAAQGHEGTSVREFSRPSGICCDDDGRVIVADSKNQRVLIFSRKLEFLWLVEIKPSGNPLLPMSLDEKDRPSDVALLPDGRLVVMVETSPDARDTSNPHKTFVQIY